MMLELLSVGKPRQAGLSDAAKTYASRLSRYTKFTESSVREERSGKGTPPSEVIRREGERLLGRLEGKQHVIVLDVAGKTVTSEGLAERIDRLRSTDTDAVCVIGGAFGLDADVIERADWVWSLSPHTFPHELVRVMALEQLYRAHTILRGEPYHK